MPAESPLTSFREVQRFSQWWLWLVGGGGVLACIGAFAWGMYQQLVLHQPWGSRPMSDDDLQLYGGITIAICLGVLALLAFARLTVEVRADGLYLRFSPFHLTFRRVPLENATSCQAVTYRPIRQYGGWGIRFGSGGKAYNVKGNRGVRIEFKNEKHLLIGSQRADELAARIQDIAPELE